MASAFSVGNRYEAQKKALAPLIALTEVEASDLESINNVISNGKRTEKFNIVKDLLTDPNKIGTIFKYIHHSKAFEDFCDANTFDHFKRWSEFLKLWKYTGEPIKSIDGKNIVTIKDQYLGSYYYSQYLKFKSGDKSITHTDATTYLDLACKVGVFKALHARCKENVVVLTGRQELKEPDRDFTLAQFEMDLVASVR